MKLKIGNTYKVLDICGELFHDRKYIGTGNNFEDIVVVGNIFESPELLNNQS